MKSGSINWIFLLVTALFITSCDSVESDSQSVDEPTVEETSAEDNNEDGSGASTKVEYVLPSPMEIASLIERTGIKYEEGILNPVENEENYNNNFKKGINLGVYGADLGLILVFEQTQDAITYFKTVKNLAEELGIAGAFEKSTIDRVEANLSDRDSLMVIAGEAFRDADMYLKENERGPISTIVLAGGWIEALFISCSFGTSTLDPQVLNRIGEQKVSLQTLISMMQRVKLEGKDYEGLTESLNDLKASFDKVQIDYEEIPEEPHPDKQITEVKRISSITITEPIFKEIASKVNAIRADLVK